MNYLQCGHLAARGSACLEKDFVLLVKSPPNAELLLMLLVLEVLPWA
jgi:hypothetical protein